MDEAESSLGSSGQASIRAPRWEAKTTKGTEFAAKTVFTLLQFLLLLPFLSLDNQSSLTDLIAATHAARRASEHEQPLVCFHL